MKKLLGVCILALLFCALPAHAQFSRIIQIQGRQNTNALAFTYASPFTIKAGPDCAWTVVATVATFNCAGGGGGFANTSLSNLMAVAINTSLLPAADSTIDVGSPAQRFRAGYFAQLFVNTTNETTTPAVTFRDNASPAGAGVFFFLANSGETQISMTPDGASAGSFDVDASGNLVLQGRTQVGSNSPFSALSYRTNTNCSDSAGAAACGAAPAGAFVVDAGATTVVVSTTAVTANSEIKVHYVSYLGTRLGITCNLIASLPTVTAITAGVSFTVTVPAAPVTNPACYVYDIVN